MAKIVNNIQSLPWYLKDYVELTKKKKNFVTKNRSVFVRNLFLYIFNTREQGN